MVPRAPPHPPHRFAVSSVLRSPDELAEQLSFAAEFLPSDPSVPFPATAKPALRDRVFYSPKPLGPKAKVAFVFPGSGNQFDGKGRDLSPHWPEVLRVAARGERTAPRPVRPAPLLGEQYRRRLCSGSHVRTGHGRGARERHRLSSLGVRSDAMIGLSLGESAGLFGVRAWRARRDVPPDGDLDPVPVGPRTTVQFRARSGAHRPVNR